MKTGIVYHEKDLDGLFSGAVTRFFLGFVCSVADIVFLPTDYGKPVDMERLKSFDRLYVVDFSFPVAQMAELFSRFGGSFVWIDHHAAKFQEVEAAVPGIEGLRRDGTAACKLAWEYFFSPRPMQDQVPYWWRCPEKGVPRSVEFAHRGDVWDLDGDVIAFGLGVYSDLPADLGDFSCLTRYFEGAEADVRNAVDRALDRGRAIQGYVDQQNRAYAKKYSFDAVLTTSSGEEHKVIAMNKGMAGTPSFDGVFDPKRYEFMVAFAFEGGKWGMSLRSVGEVDVARVARQFGGNGHRNAAGCAVEEIFSVLRRTS